VGAALGDDGEGGGTTTTVIPVDSGDEDDGETDTVNKVLRIVSQGAGAGVVIGDRNLDITATLGLRAALFHATTGDYITDVAVSWSASGGGFNSNDFLGTVGNSTTIIFDPTRTGSTVVQASYLGDDESIISPVDTTGTITVSTSLVPHSMSRIEGNTQTDTVNSVLSTALKIKVITSLGVPVPGLGINFTALTGGGTVVTAQPVLTDADGFAVSTVQLSTTPGAHGFRASVTTNAAIFVDFTATATVGSASNLLFSSHPNTLMGVLLVRLRRLACLKSLLLLIIVWSSTAWPSLMKLKS
jgi:hypothetical protein